MRVQFKSGDYVRVPEQNRVFKLLGVTKYATNTVPVGWLIEAGGGYVNPKFCKLYKGATSVFPDH